MQQTDTAACGITKEELSNEGLILRFAKRLEGMTFRDVLNLGIYSPNAPRRSYNDKKYKGGMGALIEERFFGYDANSDDRPDFSEAGVELKTTCFNTKKDGELSAGELLSITMIPYDRDVTDDFYASHLWTKARRILLVFYHRDRNIDDYDQVIRYVALFTPPQDDLRIIESDYRKIIGLVRQGRADELSEGMTTYLGAATKGSTAEKSFVMQHYPRIEFDGTKTHTRAKKRAFSFKRQYMDYVLHHYVMGQHDDAESILATPLENSETLDGRAMRLVNSHVGLSDRELSKRLDIPYTGNKSTWSRLAFRMLGIKGTRAEEFVKAGISVHTVRVEANGTIKESLPILPVKFNQVVAERDWTDSELYGLLESTRFFFVVYRKSAESGDYVLTSSFFWNMPVSDLENRARLCWSDTKHVLSEGVRITAETRKNGSVRYSNNFPGMSRRYGLHVRPKAARAAYDLGNGVTVGNVERDAERLPDGRSMTKQYFWLDRTYMEQIVAENAPSPSSTARRD